MNNKIIITLLVVFQLFSFQLMSQKGLVIEQIIAVVGDQIILKSELESQYAELKAQGILKSTEESKCFVLEDQLFTKLLINQARIDSVIVSEEEIDGEMERRLQYFINQIGSETALEEYFKKPLAEIKSELRENLEKQLNAQRMQSSITENVLVTPSEVKKFFSSLPEDSLPLINTEVEVSQIVFWAPVSKEEKKIAKDKLNSLRERITNGEDFSTMAILYSEDPGTASKGDELGLVGRAEVDPAFGAMAFKLKGNEVSRIVESQFGLHILQLIERQGERVNVRHILIKPKINGSDISKAKLKADSILNLINTVDTLSFYEAAFAFSEDKDSKNNGGKVVNPNTGSSVFELDDLDPGLYYAIEKLKTGEISQPVPYKSLDGKQGYRIVKLNKKTLAHKANMKQDYQRIQQIAENQKKSEKVTSWIELTLKKTHVKINEPYKSCNFDSTWLKSEATN